MFYTRIAVINYSINHDCCFIDIEIELVSCVRLVSIAVLNVDSEIQFLAIDFSLVD